MAIAPVLVHWSSTIQGTGHVICPGGWGVGGTGITKYTGGGGGGGWLEGLNQKPQTIYPKIAIFKKCQNHTP